LVRVHLRRKVFTHNTQLLRVPSIIIWVGVHIIRTLWNLLLWFLRQTTMFRNKAICDNSKHRREKLVSRHNGKFDNKPRGNNDYPRVIKIKKPTVSDVSKHDLPALVDIIIILWTSSSTELQSRNNNIIVIIIIIQTRRFFGAHADISSCIGI